MSHKKSWWGGLLLSAVVGLGSGTSLWGQTEAIEEHAEVFVDGEVSGPYDPTGEASTDATVVSAVGSLWASVPSVAEVDSGSGISSEAGNPWLDQKSSQRTQQPQRFQQCGI